MGDISSGFCTIADFRKACKNLPNPNTLFRKIAIERDLQLTKPQGSLGQLEWLAIWYVSWRGNEISGITNPQIVVFAGNHGVATRGVSAYPPEVTSQMVANFRNGGAAINQLAKQVGASFSIIELNLETPTHDFTAKAAMSQMELLEALSAGYNAVNTNSDLFIAGEMGIGNTTSASAICYLLFGGQATDWAGLGTGISNDQLNIKRNTLEAAKYRHAGHIDDPLEILRRVGGREIAAITGAILCARHFRIPVILDGFIGAAAAAILHACSSDALSHTVAGHISAEKAHRNLLNNLGLEPILDLDMRLGEGSGAAVAAQVLKCAVACHVEMATFAEAQVSKK